MAKQLETSDEIAPKIRASRTKVLASGLEFDPKRYEYNDSWVPNDPIKNPIGIHSTQELIEALKHHKESGVDVDARVLVRDSAGNYGIKRLNREKFLEATSQRVNSKRLKESIDGFGTYADGAGGYGSDLVGHDYTPLLGGPFNKQLYYRDYLRMHSASYFAWNNDPVAHALVNINSDFVLGKGFKVDCDDEKALMLWNVFAKANNIDNMMAHIERETEIYGETMIWKLPFGQSRIVQNPVSGDLIPYGLIPRVRVIDPSVFIDYTTHPEDIDRVLFYTWLAPTQYQIYSDGVQPTSKFIYQQIPADQIIHYKFNVVSNEKRGRSSYFPSLGYMKRLRDTANYRVIALQKAAAWCIDTEIQGDDQDINNYIQSQQELGPIAPAGSEFVHTAAVKRTYLGGQGLSHGQDESFSELLSLICMPFGIPVSYLGTHLSGGGTRASALVATEPVTKRFESKRLRIQRVIEDLWDYVMGLAGYEAKCEVIFSELITHDRSAKLKDLGYAQTMGWFSQDRVATMAAEEFDVENFDYQEEKQTIQTENQEIYIPPTQFNPLSTPGKTVTPPAPGSPAGTAQPSNNAGSPQAKAQVGQQTPPAKPTAPQNASSNPAKPSGLSGAEKRQVKRNDMNV